MYKVSDKFKLIYFPLPIYVLFVKEINNGLFGNSCFKGIRRKGIRLKGERRNYVKYWGICM
jgi:hypothetical protein